MHWLGVSGRECRLALTSQSLHKARVWPWKFKRDCTCKSLERLSSTCILDTSRWHQRGSAVLALQDFVKLRVEQRNKEPYYSALLLMTENRFRGRKTPHLLPNSCSGNPYYRRFTVAAIKMAKSKYEYVKAFEQCTMLLPNTYMIVRLDGRGFHKSVLNFCSTSPVKLILSYYQTLSKV